MKVLDDLRTQSGFLTLNWTKPAKIPGKTIRYADAVNIAVLLQIKSEDDLAAVAEIASDLQNGQKQFRIIGYAPHHQPADNDTITYLGTHDLTFNLSPKKEKTREYLSLEYDILINLCTEICLPLAYLTAKTKSHFKIGKYHSNLARYYDFMIDSRQTTLAGFAQEIKHYLVRIK